MESVSAASTTETISVSHNMSSKRLRLADLWRRKGTLLLGTILGVGLGFVVLKIFEPTYDVTARVWVERRMLANEMMSPDTLPKDFMPTQAEIMRSPLILRQALDELPARSTEVPIEVVIQGILERFTVDPLIGTQILSVRYRDRNPKMAVDLVKTVVNHYREYVQNAESQSHRERLELLTRNKDQIESQWTALQAERTRLQTEIRAGSEVKDRAKVRQAWLADLGQSLSKATTQRLHLEQQLSTVFSPEQRDMMRSLARQQETTTNGVTLVARVASGDDNAGEPADYDFGDASYAEKIQESIDAVARMSRKAELGLEDPTPLRLAIQQAKSRTITLTQKYGPKHPELRAAQHELHELERQLMSLVLAAPEALQQELVALREQERNLKEIYEKEFAAAQLEFDQGIIVEQLMSRDKSVEEEMQRVVVQRDAAVAQLEEWERVDQAVSEGRLGVVIRSLEEPVALPAGLWGALPLVIGGAGVLGFAAAVLLVVQQRAVPVVEPITRG